MKKLICFVLMAVLTIFTSKSYGVMEWYDINTQTVTTISTDTPGLYHYVDVSGQWMTWTRQYLEGESNSLDVVACDLTTGTIYNLTNAPGQQRGGAISGTNVIWMDETRSPGVSGCNLATMQPFYYAIDGAFRNDMAISGDNVAYLRDVEGNIALSVFNMGTQTNIDTITNASSCYAIGADLLAYSDASGVLKAKNIATGTTYDVSDSCAGGISTDGENILWWESTISRQHTLKSYDVLTGQTETIFTGLYQLIDDTTDVDNGRAVYTWAGSIYMYDFASSNTSLIRECWMAEDGTMINYTSPRISGDVIVWDPPQGTVPEPVTLALMLMGIAGLSRRVRTV
jgi:hypothetical protein